jgi:hypothetical protein
VSDEHREDAVSTTVQVTFDCARPAELAQFWAEALGYVRQPPPSGFESWEQLLRKFDVPEEQWDSRSAVIDPEGTGPRLFFQRVPEGKTAKNRVHLDLHVAIGLGEAERRERIESEAKRLQALGASVLWRMEPGPMSGFFVTMSDPEGNEFCVD